VAREVGPCAPLGAEPLACLARRVMFRRCVSQIPGFLVGLLSNVGNDAIAHFLHF
jgi:hypothetical protein